MPTYTVIFCAGASHTVTLEANDPDEAIDLAQPDASLCHHCARRMDLGDSEPIEVMDADGNDVTPAGLTDTAADTQLKDYEEFARWLVAMDPGDSDLATVLLNDVITRARTLLPQ